MEFECHKQETSLTLAKEQLEEEMKVCIFIIMILIIILILILFLLFSDLHF